jgi:sporulation protein YlmC with PRC-barrel domain
MALNMTDSQLIGRRVVSQDGHLLGEVSDIVIDTGTWQVIQLAVRLRRSALGAFRLKKPIFGTHTIRLAAGDVSGVGDAVVLRHRREEIKFPTGPELPEPGVIPPPPGPPPTAH